MPTTTRARPAPDGSISGSSTPVSSARLVRQCSSTAIKGVRKLTRRQQKQARRLADFRRKHGAAAAELHEQHRAIAESLKRDRLRRGFVMHPTKNRYLQRWDMVPTAALLYTAIVTPFEVAFIPSEIGPAAAESMWFHLNRVLEIIFLTDMIVQFFVAYRKGSPYAGYTWIDSHPKVVVNYLRTWFPIDFLTLCVPLAFDVYIVSLDGNLYNSIIEATYSAAKNATSNASKVAFTDAADSAHDFATSATSMVQVFKALRMLKLVRLVRLSRLVARWREKFNVSYTSEALTGVAVTLFLGAHWYSCVMVLTAALHRNVEHTWVAEYQLCNMPDHGTTSFAFDHPPLENCDIGMWPLYISAMSWSLMVITGTGGTDFYPSRNSFFETIVVTCLVVLGAVIWVKVLATFCDVATNGDPALTMFRQQVDGLNTLIAFQDLPTDVAQRMRAYMNQLKYLHMREEIERRSLPPLALSLQVESVLFVNRHWLQSVWFLRNLEQPVQAKVAMAMTHRVLAPGEIAPNQKMYVLLRGKVVFGGRLLARRSVWGDDVILSNPRNFAPYLARAVTFSEVGFVSREALLRILDGHPRSYAIVRRFTVLLAMRRHMIRIAKKIKREASKDTDEDVHVREATNFKIMDEMEHAAAHVGAVSKSQEQSMDIALELQHHIALGNDDDDHDDDEKNGEQMIEANSDKGGTGDDSVRVSAAMLGEIMASLREIQGAVKQLQEDRNGERNGKTGMAKPPNLTPTLVAVPAASPAKPKPPTAQQSNGQHVNGARAHSERGLARTSSSSAARAPPAAPAPAPLACSMLPAEIMNATPVAREAVQLLSPAQIQSIWVQSRQNTSKRLARDATSDV